jgi:hypothetical protein
MATLGNTATDTSTDGTNDDRLAYSYVAPEAGTITSMTARMRYATSTGTLNISFHADNAGVPGTLLSSVSQSVTNSGVIAAITISGGTYAFSNGVTYWIVVSSDAGQTHGFTNGLTAGSGVIYSDGNGIPGGGGTAWTTNGSIASKQICAYVTYTPSGGGGGRTLFLGSGLDGLSTNGPKQFNPSLGYHRAPTIEMYHREQERKHREFMRQVARAA